MASEIGGIDVCMLRIHSEAVGLKLMHSRLLESSSFKSIYFSCSQEQIKPKRSLIFGTRNLLLLAKSARDCRIFISRSIGRNFRHARAPSFRAKWLQNSPSGRFGKINGEQGTSIIRNMYVRLFIKSHRGHISP